MEKIPRATGKEIVFILSSIPNQREKKIRRIFGCKVPEDDDEVFWALESQYASRPDRNAKRKDSLVWS